MACLSSRTSMVPLPCRSNKLKASRISAVFGGVEGRKERNHFTQSLKEGGHEKRGNSEARLRPDRQESDLSTL